MPAASRAGRSGRRNRPQTSENGGTDDEGENDTDRYVVPNPEGGWDVVKENHERASAHTDTKKEAIDRAREIVRNQGGGEIRIANKDGKLIDADTVKGPKRGESPISSELFSKTIGDQNVSPGAECFSVAAAAPSMTDQR